MKGLETAKEIAKTFQVMKLCHIQKTERQITKKRKSTKVKNNDEPLEKVKFITKIFIEFINQI